MDLLSALPAELFIEIVSYLSDKDIRKASLVCQRWYQMFGESDECMRKLTLRYNKFNYNNDINALLKSERRYQNLNIGFQRSCIKELGAETNARAILKQFSKSLVKLQTSHDFQRICELPKLKELKYINSYWHYRNVSYFCSNGLIATCLNLTKLFVKSITLNERHKKILQEAIMKMRNLKTLVLGEADFLKNIGPEECQFKLEYLECGIYTSLTSIHKFLKCHQATLKQFKVLKLFPSDIPFIFSEFPNLHTLHITALGYSHDKELVIPENSTIKNFYIRGSIFEQECQNNIVKIISKLKNIQHIKLSELHSIYIPDLFASKSLISVKYERFSYDVTENQKNFLNRIGNIEISQTPFNH